MGDKSDKEDGNKQISKSGKEAKSSAKSKNSESGEFFNDIGSMKGGTDKTEKGDMNKSDKEATAKENSGNTNDKFGKSAKRVTNNYKDVIGENDFDLEDINV